MDSTLAEITKSLFEKLPREVSKVGINLVTSDSRRRLYMKLLGTFSRDNTGHTDAATASESDRDRDIDNLKKTLLDVCPTFSIGDCLDVTVTMTMTMTMKEKRKREESHVIGAGRVVGVSEEDEEGGGGGEIRGGDDGSGKRHRKKHKRHGRVVRDVRLN